MNREAPIGIFDSGIGGLTVANAIQKKLPKENIIYFGDTKHLPYGEKSPDAIIRFSKKITSFLLNNKCKIIIIACNTASSVAYEVVKKSAQNIPVVNVIDPVINSLTKFNQNKIGIIGTKRTILSNIYNDKLLSKNKLLKVCSLATPLLAPMIEEGFFNDQVSKTVIDSYLKSPVLKSIDTLILACTHYPLVKENISSFFNNKVNIIDSSKEVAIHVKKLLESKNLTSTKKTKNQFYVSDFTDSFVESTKFFFKEKINLKEVAL